MTNSIVTPDEIRNAVDNLSEDFFKGNHLPPENILLGIKETMVRSQRLIVGHGDQLYYVYAVEGQPTTPRNLREAFDSCITEYIPHYGAIVTSNRLVLIYTEDLLSELQLAIDFAGDKLEPMNLETLNES